MKTYEAEFKKETELVKLISSDDNYTIFNERIKVIDSKTNKILAIFLKGEIKNDIELINAGRDLDRYAARSSLRTGSAGVKKVEILNGRKFTTANPVMSSVVGYSGPSNFHPCRKTMLYNKHAKHFDSTTINLLQKLSKLFKQYAPEQFEKQQEFVNSINEHMLLKDTVYTTVTVNKDFRTLSHRDKGDYESGLGNLMVFDYTKGPCRRHISKDGISKHLIKDCPLFSGGNSDFTGGEFLLPEYEIGFNMQEGDILFVDVHQIHCNNPIKGKGRVSLVCYARADIKSRCEGISENDLINYKSYTTKKN